LFGQLADNFERCLTNGKNGISSAEPSGLHGLITRHKLICFYLFSQWLLVQFCLNSSILMGQESVEPSSVHFESINSKASSVSSDFVSMEFLVRFDPSDIHSLKRTWPRSSKNPEKLAGELVNTGIRQVILPDPQNSPEDHEFVMAIAESFSLSKIPVWFELRPSLNKDHEVSGRTGDLTSGILDRESSSKILSEYQKACSRLSSLKSFSGIKLCHGFFLPLSGGKTLPEKLDSEISPQVIQTFLSEMQFEGDWAERLTDPEKQIQFVKTTGLMPWMTWRIRRVAHFYSGLAEKVYEQTGLKITFATPSTADSMSARVFAEAQQAGLSPMKAWQWMGFDPQKWPVSKAFQLFGSESLSNQEDDRETVNHPDLIEAMKNRGSDGHWFAAQSHLNSSLFRWNRISGNPLVPLGAALTAHMTRQNTRMLILDYSAVSGSETTVRKWAYRSRSLKGRAITLPEGDLSSQGAVVRYYPDSESKSLVLVNSLPCQMNIRISLPADHKREKIQILDPELQWIRGPESEDHSDILISLSAHCWGRISIPDLDPALSSFVAFVPDDSRTIVQTRYEALLDHRSGPSPENPAETTAIPLERSEKSKGRRLMAALQAYRESRLADFFRISDGILKDRRVQSPFNRSARKLPEDSLNDRIIR
jgi:hypothetical protein